MFDSSILNSEYADIAFDRSKFDLAARTCLHYRDSKGVTEHYTIKDVFNGIVLYDIELWWANDSTLIELTFEFGDYSALKPVKLTIDIEERTCILERVDFDRDIFPDRVIHNGLYFVIMSIYLRILDHLLPSDAYEYSLKEAS